LWLRCAWLTGIEHGHRSGREGHPGDGRLHRRQPDSRHLRGIVGPAGNDRGPAGGLPGEGVGCRDRRRALLRRNGRRRNRGRHLHRYGPARQRHERPCAPRRGELIVRREMEMSAAEVMPEHAEWFTTDLAMAKSPGPDTGPRLLSSHLETEYARERISTPLPPA